MIKPFCSVFTIKIHSTDSKKFLQKLPPPLFFQTWGAYDQFFSQFLKITFNNVVKKIEKFCNFLKICEKNSQYYLRKCMREKLLIKLSAIQILINAETAESPCITVGKVKLIGVKCIPFEILYSWLTFGRFVVWHIIFATNLNLNSITG